MLLPLLNRHRHTFLSVLAMCAISVTSGCRDTLQPTVPTVDRRATLGSAVDLDPSNRDGEQVFRALAKTAPSSAGFYYDEGGILVVRVRDSRDDAASLAFVRALMQQHPGYNPGAGRLARGFRIERADFTFAELAAVRTAASDNVLGQVSGIVSVDLDERANRVTLGTQGTSEAALSSRSEANRVLALKAIDTRLLAYKALPNTPSGLDFAPPYSLQSASSDPLAGGQQIIRYGTNEGCSLGFVAQRDGVLGFVTASHCSSDMFTLDFSQFTMLPGTIPIIGTEAVDAVWYQCGFPVSYRCRGADATFIASSGQLPMSVGKILRTVSIGSGSIIVDSPPRAYFTAIYSQDDVILGQIVDMVGRTSGWTTGSVYQTCVDYFVTYNLTMHQIRCGAQGGYNANGGDSGAPIFIRVPGHPQIQGSELPGAPFWTDEFVSLVGIHSAHAFGEHFFSKLGRIKSDLGGSWVVTAPVPPLPPAPLSVYITGATDVLSSPSCHLRYVANATGGLWNTYSYNFTTDGTVLTQSDRELILAFPTAGSHNVNVTVTDANGATASHFLELVAGPSGMDCNTI